MAMMLCSIMSPAQTVQTRYAGGVPVTVNTTSGLLEGRYDRQAGVNRFLGVPYATYKGLWKRPARLVPWTGVKPVTQDVHCTQASSTGIVGQDDCLTLDIITPPGGAGSITSAPEGDGYPIQFWIHGGGMTTESFPLYQYKDNLYADNGQVITVFAHYRVDWTGFFSHPCLSGEESSYGNYALQDLIWALKYINREAYAFGGDNTKITIQGESAGGTLVSILISSPRASGLFSNAIAQSPWIIYGGVSFSQSVRNAAGSMLVATLGCGAYDSENEKDPTVLAGIAACLRAYSGAEILEYYYYLGANATAFDAVHMPLAWELINYQGYATFPIVDGYVLVEPPLESFAKGYGKDVSVIFGENADEWSAYASYQTYNPSSFFFDYGFFFANHLPVTTSLEAYIWAWISACPGTEYPDCTVVDNYFGKIVDPLQRYVVGATSGYFSTNIGMVLDALGSQVGRTRGVYRYVYGEPNFYFALGGFGAAHTVELEYVWGFDLMGHDLGVDNSDDVASSVIKGELPPPTFSPAQTEMATTIRKYWSNMIVSGSPNVDKDDLPEWSTYYMHGQTHKHTMVFKSDIPGGAAVDPCVMFESCFPEPTMNFRAEIQSFFSASSPLATAKPAATCSTPHVGYTHMDFSLFFPNGTDFTYKSQCSLTVTPFPGSLPCCYTGRKLLFGGVPQHPGCRVC